MRMTGFNAVLLFCFATSAFAFAAPVDNYLASGKEKIARSDIIGATADYKKAVELDPENSAALMAYATVLTTQKNLLQAQIYIDKYINVAGETDFICFLQAALHYYSKNYALALESFNKINMNKLMKVLAKPGVRQYFLLRGESFLKLQRYSEALDDFNHVLEADPNNAAALKMRGLASAFLSERH